MFLNIESGPIRWPDQSKHGVSVSVEAQDLILRLLDRDRTTRLGAVSDAEEVLTHPFFADFDIQKLQQKILPAPFIPKLPDLEQLREMGGQLTFKDFQETIIPTQKMELVNIKKDEFEEFGEVKEMSGASVPSQATPATVSDAPRRLGAGAQK
ncbi:hypothetical protein FGO68_gene10905 [Halteria grandinella]|uniref:non-specific serine/threonine protein kinase n=1 Tax=Halteria grandinella TaxID=5974 RepID=A0A8J8P169_HALGN|nr:hypothetical protein FGO68_gene10905 [Halteria grandinella]